MLGIEVTLKSNKQFLVENTEDCKVIGSENNATSVLVHFPDEYKNYSKRVDFKNIKNEKWTISLYTPEDETRIYDSDFDKSNFSFTLPSAVTIKGELKIQFIAYLSDSETFVPFEILKIDVKDDIMYVKKKASQNPDLILKAYQYTNMALENSRESLKRTLDAEKAAIEAQHNASDAQISAKASEQSSLESKKIAEEASARAATAETSALNSQNSAKSAETHASTAQVSADNADKRATAAEQVSSTANTKSTQAISIANTSDEKSTQALDIVDNLTVSGNEIDSSDHVSVNIETNASTKRKNIKFNIPAPKQGTSYRARGPWEANRDYVNNDFHIDTVSKFGCTFYCKVSNTNHEPLASSDSEYWGLVADKGTSVTIVDNLNSTHSDYALSAKQGKVLKTENTNQINEINRIKDNTTIVANSNGGFSCGYGAINGKGMQFKNFTICDEYGKIPVGRLFEAIYPIGSIYISVNEANPGTLFGGTWEAFAQGRTIIGSGTSDQAFSAGSSGGESKHILTLSEMPSHTHTQDAHTHSGNKKEFFYWFSQFSHSNNQPENSFSGNIGTYRNSENTNVSLSQLDWINNTGSIGYGSSWGYRKTGVSFNHTPSVNNQIAINNNTGGGQSHNNMPPYIVTYIWCRIA